LRLFHHACGHRPGLDDFNFVAQVAAGALHHEDIVELFAAAGVVTLIFNLQLGRYAVYGRGVPDFQECADKKQCYGKYHPWQVMHVAQGNFPWAQVRFIGSGSRRFLGHFILTLKRLTE